MLRLLLSEEDHTNKRSVAENADRFWAHSSYDVLAAVRGESGDAISVAASTTGHLRRGACLGGKKQSPAAKRSESKKLSAADCQALSVSGHCYCITTGATGPTPATARNSTVGWKARPLGLQV